MLIDAVSKPISSYMAIDVKVFDNNILDCKYIPRLNCGYRERFLVSKYNLSDSYVEAQTMLSQFFSKLTADKGLRIALCKNYTGMIRSILFQHACGYIDKLKWASKKLSNPILEAGEVNRKNYRQALGYLVLAASYNKRNYTSNYYSIYFGGNSSGLQLFDILPPDFDVQIKSIKSMLASIRDYTNRQKVVNCYTPFLCTYKYLCENKDAFMFRNGVNQESRQRRFLVDLAKILNGDLDDLKNLKSYIDTSGKKYSKTNYGLWEGKQEFQDHRDDYSMAAKENSIVAMNFAAKMFASFLNDQAQETDNTFANYLSEKHPKEFAEVISYLDTVVEHENDEGSAIVALEQL